jgi:hypothetical protein
VRDIARPADSPGYPPGIALVLAAAQRRSPLSRAYASSCATIARSERRAQHLLQDGARSQQRGALG